MAEHYPEASEVEKDIFRLWSKLEPHEAFSNGFNDYAGQLFQHGPEEVAATQKKLEELETRAKTKMEKAFIALFRTTLDFDEPYMVADRGVWGLYAHLVKEGVVPSHIRSFLEKLLGAMAFALTKHGKKVYSTEVKIITINQFNGLRGILEVVEKELQKLDDADATKSLEHITKLKGNIQDYQSVFQVPGIINGDFSEIYPILGETGGDIGRKHIYPAILKNMYAYPETPDEIEEKGLRWLEEELPRMQEVSGKLAAIYGCEPSIEAVSKTLSQKQNVEKKEILNFIRDMRGAIHGVMNKHLVRVNPSYDTRVLETPNYLVSFIPTAAMSPFDSFTKKPFNNFFVTTDESRAPPAGYSDLFQLIVHEEYGHCVNFSNSARSFAAKPSLLEMMPTTLRLPVSDGISFFRELESYRLLKILTMAETLHSGKEELCLLDTLRGLGDLDQIILEISFVVYKWRIIRFLRAVGDVRINMHKQSVARFVDWAQEKTGISKSMIFNQIFLFQAYVGYAPCYSMAGEELRNIQADAIARGVGLIDFNTYASSLGFPPRTIFEDKLRNYRGVSSEEK